MRKRWSYLSSVLFLLHFLNRVHSMTLFLLKLDKGDYWSWLVHVFAVFFDVGMIDVVLKWWTPRPHRKPKGTKTDVNCWWGNIYTLRKINNLFDKINIILPEKFKNLRHVWGMRVYLFVQRIQMLNLNMDSKFPKIVYWCKELAISLKKVTIKISDFCGFSI